MAGIGVLVSVLYVTSTSVTGLSATRSPTIATIEIPRGSAEKLDSQGTFNPQISRVVIGVNNTVSWINHDDQILWIEADNDRVDPNFFKATFIPALVTQNANGTLTSAPTDENIIKRANVLMPGDSFEYTFTIPGEYGFHAKPWQRGTVIVEAK